MFYGVAKINDVLDYIENNIEREITLDELAKVATLSEYEFRRIFSFVVGIPIGEYIRRRKLSLALGELRAGDKSITEIGGKFGYDSPSSFSRAFKEYYGVSPAAARESSDAFPVFVRPIFKFEIAGGGEVDFSVVNMGNFFIKGIRGVSEITDTFCCESVWKKFETECGDTQGEIYAAYANGKGFVDCAIGEKVDCSYDGDSMKISAGAWAAFEVDANADANEINALYEKILFGYLPSGGYERRPDSPNLEVFPEDSAENWHIMIPVRLK